MRQAVRWAAVAAVLFVVSVGAVSVMALRGFLGAGATAMAQSFTAPVADVLAYIPGRVRPAPGDSTVEAGVFYRHRLTTHCGVEYARFDGRWWQASPRRYRLDGARGNAPAGWGDPFTSGKMAVLAPGRAVFVADTGQRATFVARRAEPRDTCG